MLGINLYQAREWENLFFSGEIPEVITNTDQPSTQKLQQQETFSYIEASTCICEKMQEILYLPWYEKAIDDDHHVALEAQVLAHTECKCPCRCNECTINKKKAKDAI